MVMYLVIAIAFAIVIQIRYVFEVLGTVKELQIMLDIEHEKATFNPTLFSIVYFIINCLFMPAMAIYILCVNRNQVIKDLTTAIMKSYFKLEEK